ncbi:class F sortase [Streptomyces sp. TX20-6-3]|uniref:class F sortase n=1 Tax=Streptomyces sp. TX20-6-3 TaxID=3028705 RepID=UPI0029B994A0|nr:class F sortase [Streptomyces sp. TX20-6-3]MDX2563593.1 class F sortase [Streptomyces sp. TX20-6-3]
MAPRRGSRLTRRQRRLFRLARTVTVAVVLVAGGVSWAGGEEPDGPALAAAPAAPGGTGAAVGTSAALDHKAKPETKPEAKPEVKPAAKPEAKSESKSGAKVEAKPQARSTVTPRTRSTVKPEAKPKVAPKARPKAVPSPRPSLPPAPLGRSRPLTVAVPAITIEAPVMDLGLDGEGRLAAPPIDNPDVVGWYAKGVTPGERGTAVVVGHRDTRTGPAIFVSLDSLSAGNTVRVARADGRVAVFTVDRVVTYAKAEFPDKEVYGSTGRPELRLLTCGGAFNRSSGGYDANIVVFAHLSDIAQEI